MNRSLNRRNVSHAQLEQSIGILSLNAPRGDGKTMCGTKASTSRLVSQHTFRSVNLLMGYNDKNCTRLTVLVDKDSGHLVIGTTIIRRSEYWAKTSKQMY